MLSVKILLGVFIALVGRWLSHKHDGKVLESWTVKLTNKYITKIFGKLLFPKEIHGSDFPIALEPRTRLLIRCIEVVV